MRIHIAIILDGPQPRRRIVVTLLELLVVVIVVVIVVVMVRCIAATLFRDGSARDDEDGDSSFPL